MPQLARAYDETFDGEFVELPAPAAVIAQWGAGAAPADSPARQLHQRLVASFEAPRPAERKLPVRVRLMVIVSAILLPWVVGVAVVLAL